MSTINDGGPITANIDRLADGSLVSVGGLSIRDWFAGMALQGLMVRYDEHPNNAKLCAEIAYEAADAMLSARERKGES